VAIAALVRWAYLREAAVIPLFQGLVLDAYNYDEWAKRILAGDLVGEGVFGSNPLYPYALALMYEVVGTSVERVRWLQQGAGVLTAVLVFRIAHLYFGRVAALVTLALCALYGPLVFMGGEILAEGLVVFLVAAALWLAVEVDRASSAPTPLVRALHLTAWLGSGLLLGLACLGRPNLLPFAAILVLFAALRPGAPDQVGHPTWWRRATSRSALVRAGAVLIGLGLAIGPVTARNWAVGGELVLITSHSGVNLWIGNNEDADGWFRTPPGSRLAGDQLGLLESAEREAERATRTEMTSREASRWWMRRATWFAVKYPDQWAGLMARKAFYFLNAYEKPLVGFYHVNQEYSPTLRRATVGYGVLLPLAVVGIAVTWRRRREHWLLLGYAAVTAATVIAFFVSMRYRIPIVVAFLPYAGAGVAQLIRNVRGRPARTWLLTASLLVGTAVVANIPLTEEANKDAAHAQFLMGNLAGKDEDWDRAVEHLEVAVERVPNKLMYLNSLGVAYRKSGDLEQSLVIHQRAIELDPRHAKFHLNLGVTYKWMGRPDEAEAAYRKALEIRPSYTMAWHNLGNLALARGDRDEARRLWERALRIDPDFGPSRTAMTEHGFPLP